MSRYPRFLSILALFLAVLLVAPGVLAQEERPLEETPLPEDLPGEHCKVLETVAREQLRQHPGLWFLDHDTFLLEDIEAWLGEMDRELCSSQCCLAHLSSAASHAITSPLFWVSPARLPDDLPSFESVPFRAMPFSRRPDLHRAHGELSGYSLFWWCSLMSDGESST